MRKTLFVNAVRVSILVCALTFVAIPVTHAESVIWSQVVNESFEIRNAKSAYRMHKLDNPNIQIKYNARVVNVDTGQTLACGSKVAPGTKIRFEFIPHAYTDVAWFATGTSYDSPYGSWNDDAGRGTGSVCAEKNFYMMTRHTHRGRWATFAPGDTRTMESIYKLKNYMEFSVKPPIKTITGLSGVAGCQILENGNAECQVDEETTLQATFTFGETFSQMFYGFKAGIGTSKEQCYSTANPLSRTQPRPGYSFRGGRLVTTTPAASDPIQIPIPSQVIGCQINVADSKTNTPPSTPVIQVNSTDDSCISGVTISYNVIARDADTNPEDSQIRYLIDWDRDGTADQIIPSTGYVPSNTPQTFTFVTRGDENAQTFNVAAQDKGGLRSSWATFNAVRCVNEKLIIDPNQLPNQLLDATYNATPVGTIDSFSLNPKITNSTCRATWTTSHVSQCELYKNNIKFKDVGVTGVEDLEPANYELRCQQLRDNAIVKAAATCIKNPGLREI